VFEVSDKWGERQTIAGPILTVPYKNLIKDEKGNLHAVIEYAHFLPENLTINAELFPELRYRGIYEVVLYNSKLQIRGNFTPPSFNAFSIAPESILWKDASLTLGLSDLKGIRDAVTVKWNEDELTANAGVDAKDVLEIGISVKPNVTAPAESFVFAIDLDLNGSGEMSFAPVGKETKVMVASQWGNPSFAGEFLPSSRQVQSAQFNAEWKVLHLNRNYPQQWLGGQHKIMESVFGVRLLLPIDEYQKTMRTAKYAIMFIVLTFLTFFLTEVLNKKVIHPIQYILIGLALILFYTLLLSFSEHIKFNSAYLLSSLAIIALITAYTKSVLSNHLATAIIAGVLVILYGFLYIILQLQDYALLLPFSLQAQLLKGYGPKIGMNSSNTTVALVKTAYVVTDRRIGINAAFFLEWGRSSVISLVTQVEYSQRGFKEKQFVTGENSPEPIDVVYATTRLDYISLPILLKLQYPSLAAGPYLLLGPRADFLVHREPGKYEFAGGVFQIIGESGLHKAFDDQAFGGTVGLGFVPDKLLPLPLLVEARYNFDFTDNSKLPVLRGRNNSFDVWLGIKL